MGKLSLGVLLALAFAVSAMPPNNMALRMPDDDMEAGGGGGIVTTLTTTPKGQIICQPQTPCFWTIYQHPPYTFYDERNMTNKFCVCGEGTFCQYYRDFADRVTKEYRCLPEGYDYEDLFGDAPQE